MQTEKRQISIGKEPGDSILKWPLTTVLRAAHTGIDSILSCALQCAQDRRIRHQSLVYPVLPSFDTLVRSEGSSPPELAESTHNRVAVRRQVPESNSRFHTRFLSFLSPAHPPAHDQHEVSLLRPVYADMSVALLFNICIVSTICQSNLDVFSQFRLKAHRDRDHKSRILAV